MGALVAALVLLLLKAFWIQVASKLAKCAPRSNRELVLLLSCTLPRYSSRNSLSGSYVYILAHVTGDTDEYSYTCTCRIVGTWKFGSDNVISGFVVQSAGLSLRASWLYGCYTC